MRVPAANAFAYQPVTEDAPQYNGPIIVPLNRPSDDTADLINAPAKA